MISLDKWSGSCNLVDGISTKSVNVKVFNMITTIYMALKHLLCDCKWQFNRTVCNPNQKWNNDKCQCECKNYQTCKKYYSCNPSTCSCENSKYLKNIVDNSKIKYD